MKKFLRMLNDFLQVRQYEQRVREQEKKIKSELRYVQDLLLAETEGHLDPSEQAKIDVYVVFLKEERKREREFGYLASRLGVKKPLLSSPLKN